MKEIAHSYVVERVTGKKDPGFYVGSLLPDMVPYTVATDSLTAAELHTHGGEKFYDYLRKKAPNDILLAIGVLAHRRLYGADFYDDVEYRGGPGYAFQKKNPLVDEVEEYSGISHEIAIIRAHNFIELGIDYLLLQKEPELVGRVGEALQRADLEKITGYLEACFKVDKRKVLDGLQQLFSSYRPEDLNSLEGLAQIWARQAAGLPEHDRVDVEKATKVIEKAADLIRDDYEEFLDFTIRQVRKNLKPFLV